MKVCRIALVVAILAVGLFAQAGFAAEKLKVAFPARSLSYFPILLDGRWGFSKSRALTQSLFS